MKEYAIIVAGGTGTRMKAKLPKQFIEIGSLPILMHTIKQFYTYSAEINIILVLPNDQLITWDLLCKKHEFHIPNIQIVAGGATRYQSSRNGINAIRSENALVAIHDGVRPFVSIDIISNGFLLAKEKGTAVCCVECKDSVRYIDIGDNTNRLLERNCLRLIQTPQVFQLNILKKAYTGEESNIFTDDASVMEAAGYPIYLFEGDYKNLKITTEEDLLFAKILQNHNSYKFWKH